MPVGEFNRPPKPIEVVVHDISVPFGSVLNLVVKVFFASVLFFVVLSISVGCIVAVLLSDSR